MAMKKKFLGLAMAAMVAMPATTAFAANDTQSIDMGENDIKNITIPVTGSVRNKDGQAPAGRIEVELPTKMAFTVDQDGNLPSTTYTIQNRSSVGIDVGVATFSGGSSAGTGSADGIKLYAEGQVSGNRADKYRNEIELILTNTSQTDKKVDLGKFNSLSSTEKQLGTIASGDVNSIVLSGVAGTKTSSSSDGSDVDKKGTSEEFNLVFEIKKNKGTI